jgi:hypothetical protein
MARAIVIHNRLIALAPALSTLVNLPEKRPTPNTQSRITKSALAIPMRQ